MVRESEGVEEQINKANLRVGLRVHWQAQETGGGLVTLVLVESMGVRRVRCDSGCKRME